MVGIIFGIRPFNYSNRRFADVVEPVDLVFDMLGGETLTRSFVGVKSGGRTVSIKGDAYDGLADER